QVSATSQVPLAARQTNPAGRTPSAGHAVLVPLQVSATSQVPLAARQLAPAWPAGCWQVSLAPLHSSRLHGFESALQPVPAGFFASAGQLAALPGQLSARSHSPATARQPTVAGLKVSVGQLVLVPAQD